MSTETIKFAHEDYVEFLPLWCRARDVIAGEDAVKEARDKYLPRLPEMDPEEFESYLSRTKFFPASGRTSRGLHGMLFRVNPEIKLTPEELGTNVDMRGGTVLSYVKRMAKEILDIGRGGTLTDYSEAEKRPYWTAFEAEDILDWHYSVINGKPVLDRLVLREETTPPATLAWNPNDATTEEENEQIRVFLLDAATNQVLVQIWIRVTDKQKKTSWNLSKQMELLRLGQNIGFIPFVFHSASGSDECCCEPPLNDLITVNLHHYRLQGDYDHALHFTACPTAWVAGFPKETKLRIGSAVAWISENTEANAGFLEYKGEGVGAIRQALEDDKTEMTILGARLLEQQKKQSENSDTTRMRQTGDTSTLGGIAESLSKSFTDALLHLVWWSSTTGDLATLATSDAAPSIELKKDFIETQMDPLALNGLVNAWQRGAISQATLFWNLRRGEVLPPEISDEDEQARIEEGTGALAQFMAKTLPPSPAPPGGGGKGGKAGK